jgi:receptor protein-tyrosine kinase
MSIIEKALQKAQARAHAQSHAQTKADMSPEMRAADAEPSPPEPAPRYSAPVWQRSTSPRSDDSPTTRDLKAMMHIDMERLRSVGRLGPVEMTRQTEDEMRRIKWPLLNAIAGRDGATPVRNNVVLVTSATPGEGKTFTSLNLALSIVRDREMRVILVDGDVARPGLTPVLGLDGRPGLNDILDDVDMDVGAVTYQTDVEGLFFVPAGKWHQHSPEFFAGTRMSQIIEQLSHRVGNGVIILDSPPLLATNEAQAATRYVGIVLLVVRADVTEQRAVIDALALVDKSTPVKAVLNYVRPSPVTRYYGQYYYGQDYSQGRRTGQGGT